MSEPLQSINFQPYLNQIFYVRLEDATSVDLQLVNLTELGTTPQMGDRNPFSLHFLGPVSQQFLPQNTYQMVNEKMEPFDIFIVPLGIEAGRMRYEAIFT